MLITFCLCHQYITLAARMGTLTRKNLHQRNQRRLIWILCRVVPRGVEQILIINQYAFSVINYVIAKVVVNSLWFQQRKDSIQST